jgi:hypothetical protein
MSRETPLALTLWRSFSRGRREKHTWRSFIDTFVRDPEVVRDKRRVAGFSLASFEDNRRALSRVEQVHALVLDFDQGDTTVRQATRLFPETESVVYTTFSHSAECPKLRVALPFSQPVGADEYARIWDWAAHKITRAGHVLDESARDASRFWYLPSHRPGATYEWRELDGRALDVARALKESATLTRPLPGPGQASERPPAAPPAGKGRGGGDATGADQTFFGRAFVLADMAFGLLDNGALAVTCPWASEHTGGTDGDSSTVVFPPTTDAAWGLFHCSHAHCARRTTTDLLDVLPVSALEAARREHGRGLLRARVIDGWMEHLDALPEFPALDRFVLKCRPRDGGAVFTMTVKLQSTLHLRYLGSLPLPLIIGQRIDVSMEGRTVKAARLVPNDLVLPRAAQRDRFSTILTAYEPGDSVAGADFDFLFALLCRHPRLEELVGPGVRRIRVRADQQGFEIARVDGSCVGFSSGKGSR